MNSNFQEALNCVLKSEGGFVNNSKDPGGATSLGITIGTAKRYGVDMDGDHDTDIADMRNLTVAAAGKIYRGEYWDKISGDLLPAGVDYATFDLAVNSGVDRAAKFLQAVAGTVQDGKIGPKTIAAVESLDDASVINALCDKRLNFLRGLPTWGTFGRGWAARVGSVRTKALEMASSG
jgi:lysozyme family protein